MTEIIEEKKSPANEPAKPQVKDAANPGETWLNVESLDLDAQGVAHKADGMPINSTATALVTKSPWFQTFIKPKWESIRSCSREN